MSREDEAKGSIAPGQYADFTALSADYFQVPDAEIRNIVSVLTVVDGKVVYGAGEFSSLRRHCRPPRPIGRRFGDTGLMQRRLAGRLKRERDASMLEPAAFGGSHRRRGSLQSLWGPFGCGCWAYWCRGPDRAVVGRLAFWSSSA